MVLNAAIISMLLITETVFLIAILRIMARQAAPSHVEEAIAAVQSGAMSLRQAARKFDVPRTTLQRRVQRRASEAVASETEAAVVEPVAADSNAQSDTSTEEDATEPCTTVREENVTGHKRSAEHLDEPSLGGRCRALWGRWEIVADDAL
ncbi:unnamed protein product [Phytophthora lilii]|uniref:Unnamed protein product n=1 Tax=Phytophthora lilii TaxID=2077276 RepID=A0A9W6TCQ6_9STRA|nr:unnamed protein product [Phytophthora lilii]